MKIYLAARYSRNKEMRYYRDLLCSLGHEITSRWIDLHGGEQLTSCTPEQLANDPTKCARFAVVDYLDLRNADAVIAFTEGNGTSDKGKGGRHVEFGMAIALRKRVMIVGPRENVFHCFSEVWRFDSMRHLLDCGALNWSKGIK